ncbi:hypothetical protein HMPREF1486_04994 [Streptomyces sp. HPH0547]|uniref:Uncharacterized protein n=1 Tax=Streptomyces albus TaxID=1888 RepID=A0A8H1QPB3_9ACTN|nr:MULTISPECIES: DUF6284 family protein [Streptomyces]EPD91426.1 hypothetical protein HMPREF1486_04994 [Streptomyces sp. HPH0547]TGG81668.1 hypothetical protein D8771_20005 [Streptomyces albus]UVN55673.1 DUF6284 family protein [Streptomyces albus]
MNNRKCLVVVRAADGPTAAELDVIEAEMPVIDAEVELLDAQIAVLDRAPSAVDEQRIRRALSRLLAARAQVANSAPSRMGA